MFSGFMTNAWVSASMVAVVAGVVGFFVVLRGAAFQAHALPNGAFAGAAAANLLGIDPLVGLVVFSLFAATGIAALSRRGHHDVVTALALVMMLALGSLFLSRSTEYEPAIFSLLFGEVLGVSSTELVPVAALVVGCLVTTALLYRPLLLVSVLPEVAEARGMRPRLLDGVFLVVLALATAITVPVVGALLLFALMIGPSAAARSVARRPPVVIGLGVGLALLTVWLAIAISYLSNWPIGFFVGVGGALQYGLARAWVAWRRRGRQVAAVAPAAGLAIAAR